MASTQDDPLSMHGVAPRGAITFKSAVILMILYLICYPIYSLYLHPLHTFPGPRLAAISRIPYWIALLKGNQLQFMNQLHKRYGTIVRYGPNELSYADSRAWKDICTVPKGSKENGKEAEFYGLSNSGAPHIFIEKDPARHALVRRMFLPAFSDKAMKAQEPLFQKYADLLVTRCREAVVAVNMTKLYDFATFDIMADLTLGESLHMLEKNQYSPWVEMVFKAITVMPLMQILEFYPAVKFLFKLLQPKSVIKMRRDHYNHTVNLVDKRLKQETSKQDLWKYVLESDILSREEMYSNAELFMIAGTETTSSLLTGLTYYLTTNPDKMKILTDDIRGRFRSNNDITFESIAGLEYLNACIREGLRVYPSIPGFIPRQVAEGGNFILDQWIPGKTRVAIHQTATYRSSANFTNPDKFAPERWLGDPEYANDNHNAHQPFSFGPRNCLGMNMAWHEMRLLLAKLLYNFDIESEAGPNWRDQNVYIIWERKPLMCRLRDVNTTAV